MFTPPFTPADRIDHALGHSGYAVLSPDTASRWLGAPVQSVLDLRPFWQHLPPDQHLKDGGRYRRRRHGCWTLDGDALQSAPHRAHWQSLDYNALHGGIERWFEPIEAAMAAAPAWLHLLRRLGDTASRLRGPQPWFIEAHPFRIDTTDGIGRPTPEGAHRDGVDLVAVMLLARQGIKGGETRVFDANGPHGQRFTLTEPGSLLLLDDQRVVHEATPIQPAAGGQTAAYRDTLVITLRAGGFQGPG
jgi:hypothetical protein